MKNGTIMRGTMTNRTRDGSSDNATGVIKGFITVSSFIQILELEQKTCTLGVYSKDRDGYLFIRNGAVLDAETGALQGEEAAISILGWEDTQIRVISSCEKKKKAIKSSLTRLIIEAARCKDETRLVDQAQDELNKAIYLAEGYHFEKSHRLISAYLKANPGNAQAWLWYSRCLGNLKAISYALAKCAQLTPDDPQIIEEIKKLELSRKQLDTDSRLRRCPFCWSALDRKSQACHYCKASLVITKALEQKTNDHVDSKILIESVTRYTDIVAREENMRVYYFLSLANCNLNKAEEALDLLNEASRINPDNKFLATQLNIVINHVAARLTAYEKRKPKPKNQILENILPEQTGKKKILVVEDSPTTRKVVVLTLKQKGYALIEAQDGLEALSKIDEERPDLILLDIILPKMDGYKILSLIKENKELKDTPVIMLTSKDGLMDKFKGKLAGSTAYLTKPFEPKDLIKTVRKYI
jgi:twitching motility two-component system response regulator PilG